MNFVANTISFYTAEPKGLVAVVMLSALNAGDVILAAYFYWPERQIKENNLDKDSLKLQIDQFLKGFTPTWEDEISPSGIHFESSDNTFSRISKPYWKQSPLPISKESYL